MQRKLLGIISVDFDVTGQLTKIFIYIYIYIYIYCMHQILDKKWENNEAVYHLFIAFKKAYDSLRRREVLYSILIEMVSHEISKANKCVSK